MVTQQEWRLWRGDLIFFASCAVAGAIAYPLEPPWHAITFAIVIASLMLALVIGLLVGKQCYRPYKILPEIDNTAICFYLYIALTFAVALFFEPPIRAVVIVVFGTAFLIAMAVRSKPIRQTQTKPDPSTNEPHE